MPSLFDDIDGPLQAAIDEVFGEAIRVIPQRPAGNYGPGGPDPDRAAKDTVASVSTAPRSAQVDFVNTQRMGAALSLAPSDIWISRENYAALGYALRKGDVIELTDRGGTRVTISDPQPGDGRDITFQFTFGGVEG